jgi:hypothetical protein
LRGLRFHVVVSHETLQNDKKLQGSIEAMKRACGAIFVERMDENVDLLVVSN